MLSVRLRWLRKSAKLITEVLPAVSEILGCHKRYLLVRYLVTTIHDHLSRSFYTICDATETPLSSPQISSNIKFIRLLIDGGRRNLFFIVP